MDKDSKELNISMKFENDTCILAGEASRAADEISEKSQKKKKKKKHKQNAL